VNIKKAWVLVLGSFMFLSAALPGFSLVLDPRGRLGGLGGKAGSACEEFEDNKDGVFDYCF